MSRERSPSSPNPSAICLATPARPRGIFPADPSPLTDPRAIAVRTFQPSDTECDQIAQIPCSNGPTTLLFSIPSALFKKSAHLIENIKDYVLFFSDSCALFGCKPRRFSTFAKTPPCVCSPLSVFTVTRMTKIDGSAISRVAINTQRPRPPRLTPGATVGSLLPLGTNGFIVSRLLWRQSK
jgi:hypothetical protein